MELLFCSSIILPTGSIYSVNIKQPIFLVALLAVIAHAHQFEIDRRRIAIAILSIAGLFAWVPLAYFTGWSDGLLPLLQFKDVVVTASTAALVALYVADDARRARFARLAIYSLAGAALIKVGAFMLVAFGGISIVEIADIIESVFGQNLMTLDTGSVIGRLQFISDSALPIGLFYLLGRKDRFGIPMKRGVALTLVLLFSVVASFSRYIWAYAAIAVALSFLTTGIDRAKVFYGVVALGLATYFWQELSLLFEIRTSSVQLDSSDGSRTEQLGPLLNMFSSSPWIGQGWGTYTPWVIREQTLRYSYELQLVALLGQVGLIGITCFAGGLAFYYRGLLLFCEGYRAAFAAAILIGLWIASGFFNPLLMSSAAGVGFGMLYALVPIYPSGRRKSEGGGIASIGTTVH